MLCKTCKNYPRHIEEYENVREITLSLSCPEAARIVLTCQEPARFISKEDEKEEYEETHLLDRYQMPDALKKFERKIKDISFSVEIQNDMFAVLEELEALDPNWLDYVKQTKRLLYPCGKKEEKQNTETESAQNRKEFQKFMEQQYEPVSFDIQCEQIAVYFLFTYFCGAVYDGDAYSKTKFAVMSTIWIREMVMAEWQKEKNIFGFETAARIVWRFSKEIEHSDLNIKHLEQVFSGNKIFDLENMLMVL